MFTLAAAVYFAGRRVREDVSFECHNHSTSALLSPSDLDNFATFHLHELAKVLLEEAGVGAPLQQAEEVH